MLALALELSEDLNLCNDIAVVKMGVARKSVVNNNDPCSITLKQLGR